MSGAICGKSCTLTGPDGASNAFSWSLSVEGKEFDTTVFGDGVYGSTTVCGADGTIDIKSYEYCSADVNNVVAFASNVGSETFSYNTRIKSKTATVDAKGIVEFGVVLKIVT
jgi:hypothetical protein